MVPVLRPNQRNVHAVDGENNKVFNRVLRLSRNPGESQPMYFQRRALVLRGLKAEVNCNAIETWLHRLVRWCSHIARHPEIPLARLFAIQDDAWLEARRAANFDRPACRESAGFTLRWSEGWWMHVSARVGWCIAKNDVAEHALRVQILREFIFGEEQLLQIDAPDPLPALQDVSAA